MMVHLLWLRARKWRVLIIAGASAIFGGLLALNFSRLTPGVTTAPSSFVQSLVEFGLSEVLALVFFVTGSLVLLIARNRPAAWLLFAFCMAIAMTFAVETSAALNDPLLSSISSTSSSLALPAFSALMLIFPRNYLATPASGNGPPSALQKLKAALLRTYLGGQTLLSILTAPLYAIQTLLHLPIPAPLYAVVNVCFFVSISGALVTILVSYRRISLVRERQQLRFFVRGVVVACAPLLLLTILPMALGISRYAVDGRISTISFGLLPLALGYAVLRYEILVYETTVRRVILVLVGASGIAVAGYLSMAFSTFAFATSPAAEVIVAVVVMGTLVPIAIWIAWATANSVFNEETQYYARLLDAPHLQAKAALGLDETATRLAQAASEAFQTREVCLLVLETRTNAYLTCPAFTEQDRLGTSRFVIFKRLLAGIAAGNMTDTSSLDAHHPLLTRLLTAERPLLLREANSTGRGSSIDQAAGSGNDILLAPVRAQGECIAVIALGERDPRYPYAGPDFTLVQMLLTRYAPLLQTARVTHELQVAYEQQKKLDQLKDQFIMTASHELRTPLTAVQGYIALLGESWSDLPEEMKLLFLHNAGKGADELQLLVENITEASHVQTQADKVKLGEVNLSETVAHVVEIINAQFQQEQRTLQVSVPENLVVLAEQLRLRQVLLNLVKNALKYSPAGSPVEITAAFEKGERVTVRVRDYGLGVQPEEQERIFLRFVRLERDMNSLVRGTGLGLSICKQLVEAMGGHIWVESTGVEGEGSIFTFTLTVAQVEPEKTKDTADASYAHPNGHEIVLV